MMIKQIIDYVKNSHYEKAYNLSLEITDRAHSSEDALYCQWVEAVTKFTTSEHKDMAIKLMENIKPNKLESLIDFKIVNALLCFYATNLNKSYFDKYAQVLSAHIDKCDDVEFKSCIYYNIAHGYYSFEKYSTALIYVKKSLAIAKQYDIYNIYFSISTILNIGCLYYLDRKSDAQHLQNEFIKFLHFTGNIEHIKFLDEEIEEIEKKLYIQVR